MIVETMGERIIPGNFNSKEEYFLYIRHFFAYEFINKKVSKDNSVLEIGCGEGYGTSLVSTKVRNIVGLDVSKDIINHANEKYKSHNCFFELFDGYKIPFDNDSFDVVISCQVIEHVPNDINYLKEINRALKKGGFLILTTPNRVHRLYPWQKPWNSFHLREYSRRDFGKVLESVFLDVKVSGINAIKEITETEIHRVRKYKNSKLIHIVFLKILKRILRFFLFQLFKAFWNKYRKKETCFDIECLKNKYSVNDFFVSDIDLKNSLDLIGVCKK